MSSFAPFLLMGSVLGLLVLVFFWAVRVGRKMEQLERLEVGKDKLGSVSEFNRQIDEETDEKIHGDDPNNGPLTGPWLRK
jgi:hypothetical protein